MITALQRFTQAELDAQLVRDFLDPYVTERMPNKRAHWVCLVRAQAVLENRAGDRSSAWQRGPLKVISALEWAELPDGSGYLGLQWHISVSRWPERANDDDVKRALRDFGMLGAEEDNHEPGVVRNFWMPLDADARVDCECKTTEVVLVEQDGHVWTNAVDPNSCRGCHYEKLFGKPCRIHSTAKSDNS
jgi:hypothetical protein